MCHEAPPEIWTFLPCLIPLERSHQEVPFLSYGKLRHSDSARNFHSFGKQFYSGKTVAVKTIGAHVQWWQEYSREEKPTGNSADFLQTLLDSTETVSMDLLFPLFAVLMSTLLTCKLESWGAVSICTFYCLLTESLGRACAALFQRMV